MNQSFIIREFENIGGAIPEAYFFNVGVKVGTSYLIHVFLYMLIN